MKPTAEEILSKIMERDEFYLSTTETSSIIGAMEAYAAQQVAEATKDCYPKEFLLWLSDSGYQYHSRHKIWVYTNQIGVIRKTLDELFDYWTKNIKQ